MKTDPDLGKKVNEQLIKLGIENPTTDLPGTHAIEHIAASVREIMRTLGLDLQDDSLQDTPKRVAKMWVEELFVGLDYNNFPKCTAVENKFKYDEMVCETGIKIMSSCEHHWQTIHGKATVAYIPKQKVIGLSKMNRICEFFSRRPQIQERLTCQIAETLKYILGTEDVAVHIDAKHYCVIARGIQDQNSSTITSLMSGKFRESEGLRSEFLKSIK